MDDREILTPAKGLLTRAEHPGPQARAVPRLALLAWGERLFEAARARLADVETVGFAAERPVLVGRADGVEVALAHPGLGAPATALVAEKLVAAGARHVVGIGFAGGLGGVARGDVVVLERSARDEGTSWHYGATGDFAEASPDAAKALLAAIPRARPGAAWTTDAPYRETVGALARFRRLGCVAVEMESAALFAVARFRGFEAGAAVIVADTFDGDTWSPAPPGSLDETVARVADGAIAALVRRD
ncbi:MAG TPA: purine-nucleoside phosphorylase [Candidatus Thermoplasmatota archaeon]|nr:purine-nucleoside phosphorylase [Candidatus Thermoplasmatota archaeon]